MKFTVRPLTPDSWPQLEELFGRAGACNGCWCMYWRIGGAYTKRPRDANRKAFKAIVRKGSPSGLLAFADDLAVGWAQVTPRTALPHLDRGRFTKAVDNKPVWSLTCFYIRKGWRGKGITTALIDAATTFARKAGASAVEAYPTRTGSARRSNSILYTGAATTFARAGFKTVALPAPHRPTMRLSLKRAAR